jgi:hypothetical protein
MIVIGLSAALLQWSMDDHAGAGEERAIPRVAETA